MLPSCGSTTILDIQVYLMVKNMQLMSHLLLLHLSMSRSFVFGLIPVYNKSLQTPVPKHYRCPTLSRQYRMHNWNHQNRISWAMDNNHDWHVVLMHIAVSHSSPCVFQTYIRTICQ